MKATRLWQYDENDELMGNRPIGSLNEPARTDIFYKIFDDDKNDEDVPKIVVFGHKETSEDILVRFEFTGERPQEEVDIFWDNCRNAKALQPFVDRWGEVVIQWGGPGYADKKTDCTVELIVYYDKNGGTAWLDRHFSKLLNITYKSLFDDFDFLREFYRSKKG